MDSIFTNSNHIQTISKLNGTDPAECRKVMSNYDSFIERIQRMISVQSVQVELEKAARGYSDRIESIEENYLLTVFYEIDSKNITDEDLKNGGLRDYVTGTNLTIGKIKERLEKLGWKAK